MREIIDLFCAAAKRISPFLNPIITERVKTREFPNGKVYTSLAYRATLSSKILYTAIKNCKQKDYRWYIPSFLTSDESLIGFLRGLFDSEGSVFCGKRERGRRGCVSIASKHAENLEQVRRLLSKLGIHGWIYFHSTQKYFMLHIYRAHSIRRFAKFIGFRINLKRLKLEELLNRLPTYREMKENLRRYPNLVQRWKN